MKKIHPILERKKIHRKKISFQNKNSSDLDKRTCMSQRQKFYDTS